MEETLKLILDEIKNLKSDISGLKEDISSVKQDVSGLKEGQGRIETKVDNLSSELRSNFKFTG